MWFYIITKLVFIIILWRGFLSFSGKRSIYLYAGILLLMTCFLFLEIIFSWQYELFSLMHIILHPSLVFWLNLVSYLVITLIFLIIFFTRRTLVTERLRNELIQNQLSTELNFLQAQIHPHFLFNTLNNLFSIAQRDRSHDVAKAISMLSSLMRYMLYESKSSRVPLTSEIAYIRNFIGLAKMRYTEEEANLLYKVEGTIDSVTIAPMILLPFVENAFKHGVLVENKSWITISVQATAETILFTCVNQKSKVRHPEETGGGIGLTNVRRRLSLLYPEKHRLEIRDQSDVFEVELLLMIL